MYVERITCFVLSVCITTLYCNKARLSNAGDEERNRKIVDN